MGRTFAETQPLAEEDIELLDHHLPFGRPDKHRERFGKQQEGKVVYLVARHGNLPIGQAQLRWDGSPDEPMASRLHSCPEIEDLGEDDGIVGIEILDTSKYLNLKALRPVRFEGLPGKA